MAACFQEEADGRLPLRQYARAVQSHQAARKEELLRLLLDQAKDHAFLLLDAGGIIVCWLAGAEHIFGYTAEEMPGQTSSRPFTPEDRERGLAEHELEVARNDGRAEDDRWEVRKDGTSIWVCGVLIARSAG